MPEFRKTIENFSVAISFFPLFKKGGEVERVCQLGSRWKKKLRKSSEKVQKKLRKSSEKVEKKFRKSSEKVQKSSGKFQKVQKSFFTIFACNLSENCKKTFLNFFGLFWTFLNSTVKLSINFFLNFFFCAIHPFLPTHADLPIQTPVQSHRNFEETDKITFVEFIIIFVPLC